MQIIFEGDTALSLVQQMQQYITDTSVGAVNHEYIAPVPNVVINHSNPDFVKGVVEQPEVPGQPDASGLDKAGFPWDARIHSGGKSMNADGTWRYKKGADKAVIQSVEAELAARLNGAGVPMPAVVAAPPAPAPVSAPPAPAPVSAPPAPAPVSAPPAPAPVSAPPAPAPVSAPPAPAPVSAPPAPAPVSAPPAPAPVAAGGATPATIVNLISTLKLDVPTAVLPVLNNFGLNTLPELFQPQAAPMLGAIYAALGGQ